MVHSAYRSGSINGVSSLGELSSLLSYLVGESSLLGEVSITLTIARGDSSSCLY